MGVMCNSVATVISRAHRAKNSSANKRGEFEEGEEHETSRNLDGGLL